MSGEATSVELENDDALEIEVVDDTPPEDRNRQPPAKPERTGAKDEAEDDELAQYGEGVQKRIKRLKWEYHEERRAKEQAAREAAEALRFAQAAAEENKRLMTLLQTGEKALVDQAKKRAETELAQAKADYRAAYDAGDTDKVVEAQERMTRLVAETREIERWRPSIQAPEQQQPQPKREQPTERQPAVQRDAKAEKWWQENPWFSAPGYEDMTSLASGLHEKLVKQGVDPRSDDYYGAIDAEMRRRFPDYFESEGGGRTQDTQTKKPASVVAPAARTSPKTPRKVQLTATQVALAKRLGITPERYAAQLLKEMGND